MKEKQFERRAYVKPVTTAVLLESGSFLMNTSFPNSGGHNKAADDGDDLQAKRAWFDDEASTQQWDI